MGKRIAQVSRLIRDELGKVFTKDLDLPRGTILTITRVDTAPDCKNATVWVSVLPENTQEQVMAKLLQHIGSFQAQLNKTIVMQFTPKITFKLDRSGQKADRILRLLDNLD